MEQRTADITGSNCERATVGQISFGQVLRAAITKIPNIGSPTKYYQTENAMESVCIIEDPDGAISIGFARAGRIDKEFGRITSEDGLDIAKGRAEKARKLKIPLIEKNYVRGIYLPKIER